MGDQVSASRHVDLTVLVCIRNQDIYIGNPSLFDDEVSLSDRNIFRADVDRQWIAWKPKYRLLLGQLESVT